VPGGEVVHCSQALVIDESVQIVDTEPCGGVTDNPELCSTYTCTAGTTDCPPVDTSTSTTTDTSGSTDSTGTTGSGTGTADSPTSSGGYDNLGGSDTTTSTTPGNGNGHGRPTECSYVDACSAGASDVSSADADTECAKNNCNAPGVEKKSDSVGGSSTTGSSNNGNGNGNGNGSASSTTSSSTTSTTQAPKQYKCAKDKKGNKVCESIPTCVAGSHASACGACVPDGEADDCVKPAEGGCWVTGGGFIIGPNITTGAAPDGHDNFGGNAKPMKDGRVQGHWNHVDHGTGNHAKGIPSYIVCRHLDEPGPGGPGAKKGFNMNQVYFGGPAEWRVAADGVWQDGYWFDVVAKDHGEPGSQPSVKNGFMPDTYHFTIRKQDDPTHQASGTVVYETKETLTGGNIQMHPPNGGHPYTPMQLPSWVTFEP
jgi:hypothetical protein